MKKSTRVLAHIQISENFKSGLHNQSTLAPIHRMKTSNEC